MKRSALAQLACLVLLAAALPALAGEDAKGYLGVTLAEVDVETADDMNLGDRRGALILTVFDDSPADEAGLEAGDVVLEFAGEHVDDAEVLTELVRARQPGDEVKVKVQRGRKTRTCTVTLAEREEPHLFVYRGGDDDGDFTFDIQGLPGMVWMDRGGLRSAFDWRGLTRLGVEARDLEAPLAAYFPKVERGALVLGVQEESPAEAAKLEPGDVIVELDGRSVGDLDDLHHAVRKAAGKKDVALVYMRQGKRLTAHVDLEDSQRVLKRRLRGVPQRLRFPGGEPRHWRAFFDLDEKDMDEHLQEALERLEERLEQLEERLDED
ncbi:MAG: PDZ domain-containing protein [Candidatus Krumholzibacteriota bacterium]|nr:PDZ domain-containing protein [Candidatus Krumholzibacteriota bacterium]